jgi:hypothetical protein
MPMNTSKNKINSNWRILSMSEISDLTVTSYHNKKQSKFI